MENGKIHESSEKLIPRPDIADLIAISQPVPPRMPKADTEIPTVVRDRSNKLVLEEDSYAQALDRIIERDFFPNLKRLRANIEYMDALEVGDAVRMRNLALDMENAEERDNLRLSLDEFQARYTGEDNASFGDLVESQNEIRRKRYNQLFRDRVSESMRLTSSSETQKLLTDGRNSQRLENVPLVKNALMNYPEGLGSQLPVSAVSAKIISHSNTRLVSTVGNDISDTASISTAITANAESTQYPSLEPQYAMVDTIPSPAPGRGGATPMLTWGNISSTPVVLNGTDSAPFKIPDVPARDALGKRLGDRATKEIHSRNSLRSTFVADSKSSHAQRTRMLSPAAQSLLRRSTRESPSPWASARSPAPLHTLNTSHEGSSTPMIRRKKRQDR